MTTVKSSLICVGLVGGGAWAMGAGVHVDLKPEDRRQFETDVVRWKALLEEYHQGKRDDSDAAVILSNILHDNAMLGVVDTAENLQARKEWADLLKKHPKFGRRLPTRLHEQTRATQMRAKHQAEIEANVKKEFKPKDSKPVGIYGYVNNVVGAVDRRRAAVGGDDAGAAGAGLRGPARAVALRLRERRAHDGGVVGQAM